jgi:cytochrome oxidase Cu insertion factor (SCO1/SenC/PrrC family)
MPVKIVAGALLAVSLILSAQPANTATQDVKVNHTTLKTGDMAPDFTLLDNHWKQVRLADYRGKKNVVLAFYVLAFTAG